MTEYASREERYASLAKSLAFVGDVLTINDPKHLEELVRKRWSVSSMKSIESCPARFAIEKLCPEEPDPFGAAELGKAAHCVFEEMFDPKHDPQTRTKERAREILSTIDLTAVDDKGRSEVVAPDRDDVKTFTRWLDAVWEKIEPLWNIEDPTKARVFACEEELNGFVTLDPDDPDAVRVPMVGFIDRTDVNEDGEAIVVDYKGLALDTPIATPTGFTTMADIQVGDSVMGTDGGVYEVTGKSNVYDRPCYRVTIEDGSSIVCDNVHLWSVTIDGDFFADLPTDELYRRANADDLSLGDRFVLPLIEDVSSLAGRRLISEARIVHVERIESVPTQCIEVSAPDSLFLGGPTLIPLHNSGKFKDGYFRGELDDPHGDQIRLYSHVLRNQDRPVGGGTLYYTGAGKARDVDLSDSEVDRVVAEFVETYEVMKNSAESGEYETRPSPLCGWCQLALVCPSAKAQGKRPKVEKAKEGARIGIKTLPSRPEVIRSLDVTPNKEKVVAEVKDRRWGERGKPGLSSALDRSGKVMSSSYTTKGYIDISRFAVEVMTRHDVPFNSKRVIRSFAATLVDIVESVEESRSNDGLSDWQQLFNEYIRDVLRTVTELEPIPFDGDEDAWKAWSDRAKVLATIIVDTAFDLATEPVPEVPWAGLPEAIAKSREKMPPRG